MAQVSEQVIHALSGKLREWVHDVNNALFVSRGFIEEIQEDVVSQNYTQPDFDHENLKDMMEAVARNLNRIDKSLQKLRKISKEDIFDLSGLPRP